MGRGLQDGDKDGVLEEGEADSGRTGAEGEDEAEVRALGLKWGHGEVWIVNCGERGEIKSWGGVVTMGQGEDEAPDEAWF